MIEAQIVTTFSCDKCQKQIQEINYSFSGVIQASNPVLPKGWQYDKESYVGQIFCENHK